jgi:RHS repeat-associated protein
MNRLPLHLLLTLLVATSLASQEHPSQQRGFRSDGAYRAGEFDVVNAYNGNLSLVLPIGQRYPVGGDLSYQLKLVYNSHVWDYIGRKVPNPRFPGEEFEKLEAIPSLIREAGVGWTLSFGRLFDTAYLARTNTFHPVNTCDTDGPYSPSNAGWMYVDANGGKHCFYRALHEGEPPVGGVFYTRDGSYLRLKTSGASSGTVEFPDGTIHTFVNTWPTRLADRFGNFLRIDGAGAPPWQGESTWTLTDSVGRVHKVNHSWSLVRSVELQTFGQVAPARSVWTFNYALLQMIERPSKDTYTCFDPWNPDVPLAGCDRRATVHLLTEVKPPIGNSWTMTYNTQEKRTDGWFDPWYYRLGALQVTEVPGMSGTLASLRLPERGRVEWRYMAYHLPAKDVKHVHQQITAGVADRRLFEANGAQVPGEWRYVQSFNWPPAAITAPLQQGDPPWSTFNTLDRPDQVVTTMTDPLGHRRVSYFWARWNDWQFGLPITPLKPLVAGDSRFRSEETFAAGKSVALQTTYLAYDRDALTAVPGPENHDWSNSNRRVLASSTKFEGGGYSDFTHADFDGFGNYRTTWRAGAPGNAARTEVTRYNDGVSSWPVDKPWILGTYIWTIVQPGSVFRTFCWDPNTGVLKARRVHAGTINAYSDHDLVEVFGYDAAGNRTSDKFFGGTQGVGTDPTWICPKAVALTGPTSPAPTYQINHTYSAGVRATSSYAGTNFKTLDQDIDLATGLPARRRDSAELVTTYAYDALGRPTRVDPAQEAATDFGYPNAGSGLPARVTVTRAEAGVAYAEEKYSLDGFGRVAVEEERLPGGAWSARFTFYNPLGWKDYVTERGVAGPGGPGTRFINYDPLGRPGRIRPADGSAHDVDLEYVGVSQVTRKVKALVGQYDPPELPDVPEQAVSTREVFDSRGRLIEVHEIKSSVPLTENVTKYEYDVFDNLTRVLQSPSQGPTQERRFGYDNRGFLLWEEHPEKDPIVPRATIPPGTGGHDVSYFDYDARGHAGRSIDGARDLTIDYDAAGRPTRVRQTGSGFAGCLATFGPRCWKEFTYASFNSGANARKGKLETATRYNYLVLGGTPFRARVVETYTYAGVQGRVSSRLTDHYIHNGATGVENPSEGFSQSWQYTPGGEVASRAYPRCIGGGCFGAASPRTVSSLYAFGRLTAVPGYAGSIAYHTNGLVSEVAHTNLVTDVQAIDEANMMPRPAALHSRYEASKNLLWSSGGYRYDGAGNIKSIGTSVFLYDQLLRLVGARVFAGAVSPGLGPTPPYWQIWLMEDFGNIYAIGGVFAQYTRQIPMDSTRNRLCGPACGGTAVYDAAGSLTFWNGQAYEYDDLGMVSRSRAGSQEWLHIYTADDERLWSYQVSGGTTNRWTLRDLDQKVLREYSVDRASGVQTLDRDYVHAAGRLLAAQTPTGVRHYHLDHLGTPRLITNAAGQQVAFHTYFPFGEELTYPIQDSERLKFTGHERDLNYTFDTADDLDYMHARFYNPLLARFLSVDPILGSRAAPQSWNRYAYVMNRALIAVDPDGLEEEPAAHIYDTITVTTSTRKDDSATVTPQRKRDKLSQDTEDFFASGRSRLMSGRSDTPIDLRAAQILGATYHQSHGPVMAIAYASLAVNGGLLGGAALSAVPSVGSLGLSGTGGATAATGGAGQGTLWAVDKAGNVLRLGPPAKLLAQVGDPRQAVIEARLIKAFLDQVKVKETLGKVFAGWID